jgi:hypothetical protein
MIIEDKKNNSNIVALSDDLGLLELIGIFANKYNLEINITKLNNYK